jgi:CRISPR-associated protein Cas1
MRLVIDDYGAYLKKKGRRFVVVSGDKREEYASGRIEQVLILRGAALSTDAVELAMEKGIDIVCLDRAGKPFARIYPCRLGGTTLTRRNQLMAFTSQRGTTLAKAFVRAKLENMGNLLKSLGKSRRKATLKEAAAKIIEFSERAGEVKGKMDEVRNVLLGIEGEASKILLRYQKPTTAPRCVQRLPELRLRCALRRGGEGMYNLWLGPLSGISAYRQVW